MKERRFGRGDSDRVQRFYSLQWEQHEGVLIPNEKSKSAIWDAPKTLFQGVSSNTKICVQSSTVYGEP